MKLKSFTAIVLSATNINEIDLLLDLLTPAGRIAAIAKGARKSRHRFLNLFSELNILRVNTRKSVKTSYPIIDSADLIYQLESPWHDLTKYYFFNFVVDLLKLLGCGNIEWNTFRFWATFIKVADATRLGPSLVLLFKLKILQHLGFAPRFDECIRCGRKPQRVFYFSIESGGLLCLNCRGDNLWPLTLDEVQCLREYLAVKDPERLPNLPFPKVKVLRLIQQFLIYYLELDYKKVFGYG